MFEYIERKEAINKIKRRIFTGKNLDGHELSFNDGVSEAVYAIEDIRAADVREVRHGTWVPDCRETDDYWAAWFSCSLCGFCADDNDYHYCPFCGAIMDGKDGENNVERNG